MNMQEIWEQRRQLEREGKADELRALPLVFRVRMERKQTLVDAVTKQKAQAARIREKTGLDIQPPTLTWGDELENSFVDPETLVTRVVRWQFVQVEGTAPQVPGWKFIAVIEHLRNENTHKYENLIRSLPGVDVSLSVYQNAEPNCDHCNKSRRRNDTYIVMHDDGRLLQVGSACLLDYTGGLDPAACAKVCEWPLILEALGDDLDSEDYRSGGRENWFPMEDVLAFVQAAVRTVGWRGSKEQAHSTKALIEDWAFTRDKLRRDRLPKVTDEDKALVSKIVEWTQSLTSGTDFDHNMRTVGKMEAITPRHFGFVAYMPEGYRRHVEAEAKRKASVIGDSEFIGQPKEKVTVMGTVLKADLPIQSFYVSYLQEVLASDGNLVKWFATSPQGWTVGEAITLKGTIKKHEERYGTKATVLTRCKRV